MPAAIAVPLIISAVGFGVQAYGQHKAGQAAKKAGQKQREASDSQAALADYNAQVAELQAKDAIERGVEEEGRFRSTIRLTIGAQRAGLAAGNTDVGFGSAVDVQADAAYLGELDALTIRVNASREAWGYKVQGEDLHRRAEIARKEGVYLEAAGRQQGTAGNWAAAGTLIGGGASLLQARYAMSSPKTTGVLPSRQTVPNMGYGPYR